VARGQTLGVIGERKEVQGRAEAGEVAGVGRGVRPLPAGEGEAAHEGIGGEGGVDVEIAEEDALGGAGPSRRLPGGARAHPGGRELRAGRLAGPLVAPSAVDHVGRGGEQGEEGEHDPGPAAAALHR
jgi:hypothetical protein